MADGAESSENEALMLRPIGGFLAAFGIGLLGCVACGGQFEESEASYGGALAELNSEQLAEYHRTLDGLGPRPASISCGRRISPAVLRGKLSQIPVLDLTR